MSGNEDFVFFELNNWFPGEHYPDAEPFVSWMGNDLNLKFGNDAWVKENRLFVRAQIVDMSVDFCIVAERKWVEENCPELLTKYAEFLRFPDEDGVVEGQFGTRFPDPYEDGSGVEWVEEEDYG